MILSGQQQAAMDQLRMAFMNARDLGALEVAAANSLKDKSLVDFEDLLAIQASDGRAKGATGDAIKNYTVFCRESGGTGTTWISSVEATDVEDAKRIGLENCAADWGYDDAEGISVIGVATGDIQILDWDDGCL